MESLENLHEQLRDAKEELGRITIKKNGSVPWAPNVQDQYKSKSYVYEEYTDVSKAYKLKEKISNLEDQNKTYSQRAREEREREETIRDSLTPQYDYDSAGKSATTTNPAIAARYDAQHRFFGMNKLQKTLAILTGQKRKFKKLWNDSNTTNKKTQEQVVNELRKLFR